MRVSQGGEKCRSSGIGKAHLAGGDAKCLGEALDEVVKGAAVHGARPHLGIQLHDAGRLQHLVARALLLQLLRHPVKTAHRHSLTWKQLRLVWSGFAKAPVVLLVSPP